MTDTPNTERIHDYLRQHRSQYELPVLRAQLLGAGYAVAEVDAAIATLEHVGAALTLPADPLRDAERERTLAAMTAYLQQHGGSYDLDALRRQLLQAGQPADAVEEAVRRASLPPRQATRDGLAWPAGLLVALLNLTLLPVFAGALTLLLGGDAAVALFSLVPSLVLLAEFVGGLILATRGPRRRLGRVLLWGVLFSLIVPFFLFVAFLLLVVFIGIGIFAAPGFSGF